jgi:hypothetical protein
MGKLPALLRQRRQHFFGRQLRSGRAVAFAIVIPGARAVGCAARQRIDDAASKK